MLRGSYSPVDDLSNLRPLGSARSNPLFDATRARKKAEQDSILLANRIRLLRAEEARTRKKISDTEKKTQEILRFRHRNEQRRQEKEQFEAQKEWMEHEFRTKQMVERIDQQHKILDKKKQIQERNALGGSVARQQRQHQREVVDLERQAHQDEAFARAEQVRAAMDKAARSRARSEGAKQELAKDVLRERLLREEDARRMRLKEVERMEQEEAELLERLHRSQERHRMAYMQLEDVLRQGSNGSALAPSFTFEDPYSGRSTPTRALAELGPLHPPERAAPHVAHVAHVASEPERHSVARQAKPPLPRAPPGARPSSASRVRMAPSVTVEAVDAVDRLRQKHSASAMSNTSTAIGESCLEGPGEGSNPSTPSSAPQIRYTTVDGVQLDIPAEEDLDLAALLNGR